MDGRVALITGAASGLGAECARLFAEEGARIIVADVHRDRGAEVARGIVESGGEALFVYADVTGESDLQAAVELAESSFGKLDTVVANAGSAGRASRFHLDEVTEDDFAEVLQINVLGVWRTFKAAVPALRRAGGGAMTSTGSATSLSILGGSTLGAYTTSKHGSLGLTKFFAAELAPEAIRVNCVCPGRMLTNFDESLHWNEAELAAARIRRGKVKEGPGLRPMGHPREVALVHLFLCSDEASYVTGQAIEVDGGMDLMYDRSAMITG